MHRYFIIFAYDGTNYHGWQIQPNGNSVQAELQHALALSLRSFLLLKSNDFEIEVVGAGRTDAGVHARQMAAHFELSEEEFPLLDESKCKQIVYRINRILPRDISVSDVYPVESDMHARFSAKWRTYHYYIHTDKNPFLRFYSLETHYPLDFDLMNEGGKIIMEHQDFAAFCKAGADNKTTLCDVTECKWVQTSPTSWYLTITANRFLRNMVRAVVGTLFLLGRHKITLDDLRVILLEGNRSKAGESMPGNALFLEKVEY